MKIKINQELCVGCGACQSLCPKVFKIKKDGEAYVINSEGCKECNCPAVVDSCPAQAITLEE
jgi:ferredoxin